MKKLLTFLLLLCSFSCLPMMAQKKGTFEAGKGSFMLNGKPFIVKAAEMHYPRIPRPYWDHRIKMAKALGMNTICIYIFWNIHEQREGQFDFSDNNDVAAFCKLAQKNGMYVIVRPGPYVCAEWEMGGLPWWLLKKKDIRLREQDPYFMERVKIFEEKVGEQLAGLTVQKGGPIIMVQVENEYGSYGEDKPYVSAIRDCLRGIYGKELALFQCDWSSNFEKNGLDDLVWTMNFGTGANIDQQFRRLGQLRPDAPKMCSEFWSGWFDKWGARHETRDAKDMVDGMDEMLSKGISFSLYMTHGGTSFGHWAGANSPGFAPDVTSYDYDAPINEYGLATPKFYQLREMMAKYNDGKKMPAVPKAPMPIITVPKFELTEFAPLFNGFDWKYTWWEHEEEAHGDHPKTFEELDMGWGSVLYCTRLPDIPLQGNHLSATESTLTIDAHDFAQVFIDGKYVGKIDRVKNEKTLTLPPIKQGQELQILVEGMGRINFGRAIKDFKGLVSKPTITTSVSSHLGGVDNTEITYILNQWESIRIPDGYEVAVQAFEWQKGELEGKKPTTRESLNEPVIGRGYRVAKESDDLIFGRGYYRGYFNLSKVGDTFLNFETWGKGQVYVNGHAMGRIWSIGPQQTLYVPGCWLKKGKNEIIVLDVVGPKEAVVWGQDKPELDKLQLEKSNKHNNIGDKPDLNSDTPAATGAFAAGNGWQKVNFAKQAKGRLLCIECLSAQDGKEVSAIAEIYALDAQGKRLSREPWTTKYADSENENGNHTGDKVYDLQESTYWQTSKGASFPHLLVIDLGSEQTVSGIEYLPRAEQGAPGSVKNYRIYVK
ncbi:MAG: beta-galactosidase [Bacteroidaceae bacterium]|nr:beta-galactosidase [Bacteroidaceae bacterium]